MKLQGIALMLQRERVI